MRNIKEWTIDNNNDYFNHEKNLLAIQAMCIKRNIKLIHIDSFKVESSSLARDLEHPGAPIISKGSRVLMQTKQE